MGLGMPKPLLRPQPTSSVANILDESVARAALARVTPARRVVEDTEQAAHTTSVVADASLTETPLTDHNAVVLVDTIGELGAVWGLADVAFVGGSLDGKRGGQNMLEPAAYGAAVVFGPHVGNFRDAAARLVGEGGALQVADAAALERVTADLLASANKRRQLGTAARRLVLSQQGATERTLQALDFLVAPPLARVG